MNIIFSTNDNGVCYLLVSMYSIIINNKRSELHFYILNSGLNDKNMEKINLLGDALHIKISFIKIQDKLIKGMTVKNNAVPIESYYRYLSPNILNEGKALYVDIDMMCTENIEELYSTDLEGSDIGWVCDSMVFRRDDSVVKKLGFDETTKPYFNSGLILMDLESMRNNKLTEKFIENIMNRKKLIPAKYDIFNDQTIANLTFTNSKKLSMKFNTLVKLFDCENIKYKPVFVHFSGRHKPLTFYKDKTIVYMDLYYKYAREIEEQISYDVVYEIVRNAGHKNY